MKKFTKKAIALFASLTLLLGPILPLSASAAAAPKAGSIRLVTGTTAAFKTALTYNVPVNGSGEYNLAINDAYVAFSGVPLSYFIVEFVPHNVSDQITAEVDRKDGNGYSDLLANGTTHFNAAFYPTATEDSQPSVVSGSGGRFSTVASNESIQQFDLRINVKSQNGTDYDVNYVIHITRTASETAKVLDAAINSQTTETDKLDYAGQYLSAFKKLSAADRALVTNKVYFGSDVAVKTGSTTLNVDTAFVSAYYPAADGNAAVPGTGSIDLPSGASSFQITSIDGAKTGVIYAVNGGTPIAAGTNAAAKPASGSTITITNGTKTYNLTVNFTDAAEITYLKKVLTQFYADENLESLGALAFAYIPRYSARTAAEQADLSALEADLFNTAVNKFRTAGEITEPVLNALKSRYEALPTVAKTAITAVNIDYLNTAVPAQNNQSSSTPDTSNTSSSSGTSSTSSTSSTGSPKTGEGTFPVAPFAALIVSAALVGVLATRKKKITGLLSK